MEMVHASRSARLHHAPRRTRRPGLPGLTRAAAVSACGLLALAAAQPVAFGQARLAAELYASGFNRPLFLTHAPGDTDRLFVLEQNTALIRIIENGQVLATPFLDLGALASSGGERGLLGLAFHPDYDNNGWFFVNYTDNAGDTVIARYTVSAGDPNIADPDSAETILTLDQPYSNHNGGMIAFGPNDGYFYIGTGDGGSGGDPQNFAQTRTSLLGKMLRLDVDNGLPYTIPADNPFVNDPSTLDEIWAIGVRNPWRWSFDRATGDLWMGDVGQSELEEINIQFADSPGGENYGWRLKEGTECYNPSTNCDPGGLTDPIYEYTHGGNPFRCSITGGYVYRGEQLPLTPGTYFFSDYCSNQVWTLRYENGNVVDFQDRTADLEPAGSLDFSGIASYGEDAAGELYIIDLFDGEIFKIVTEMKVMAAGGGLVSGQDNTLEVTGAAANRPVYFVASLAGPGVTNVPQLGVQLGLRNPQLLGSAQANANGEASLTRNVPGTLSGVEVWIQVAQTGNTSNLQRYVIQ